MPRLAFFTRRTVGRWVVAVLLLGFRVNEASAEADSPELTEAIRQARAMVAKDASHVPGLAVAVAYDGRIVWSEGFGYADLTTKRPVSAATTRFRIASLSKPLTAAGLMRLVERGGIDLDAPVQRYVPAFPVKPEGVITTRLLAGHLAGIRHYRGLGEALRNDSFPSVTASLAIFADDPLVSAPGEKFHYSTYGYTLVSAVMEAASHREFLDWMQTEVFTPLGLEHTRPDRSSVDDPDRTQFYQKSVFAFSVTKPTDSSSKWAGGGFLSTAEDMAKFGAALTKPGFLKPESLAQLFTAQKPRTGQTSSYGIGWGVVKNFRGRTFYLHTGDQPGATTFLVIRPEAKISAAILCNVSRASLMPVRDAVLFVKCFDGLASQPEPAARSQSSKKND